jgi:zinc protease
MKNIFFCLLSSFVLAEQPKVLFEGDPAQLITSIHIAILSGSQDDPRGKPGVMNLVSQLLLRGTKKKSREAFQKEAETLGGSFSASTSHDMTLITARVIKENTTPFLKLIEEALITPSFNEKEFQNLKEETMDSLKHIKNNNNALSSLAARKEIFSGTVLEYPEFGNLNSLKEIKHEDVLRAYNNQFHRAHVLFAVSSALKEDELKKRLTEIWLKLPDGAKLSHRAVPLTTPSQPKLIVIQKTGTSTGSITYAQQGITISDPARYTLLTSDFSFGGEPLVSRLFRIVRAELGYTYSIRSRYNSIPFTNQMGFYTIGTTPSIEFTAKTLFKVLELWKEYYTGGLNSDDISLAKDSQINSYPFDFENASKRLGLKLSSHLYNVPILNQEQYESKISSISNSEIKAALAKKHSLNGWVITLVADSKTIEKQLEEEQKNIAPEKRLKISKVINPEDVIN